MARKKASTTTGVAVSRKFESLCDFSKWLESAPVGNGFTPDFYGSNAAAGAGCDQGTENFQAADALMRDGWDAGAADVKKIMFDRCDGYESVRRLALSVVGVVPCIPAYMANSPKNMIAIRRRNVPRPVVTICYNCAAACDVTAEEMTTAAAKLLNVVRGLESGGVGVELWAVSAVNDNCGRACALAVKIKNSSEPFNVLNMSYPLIHPSMLRRHGIAYIERAGGVKSDWRNYGRPISSVDSTRAALVPLGLDNADIFCYYNICDKSESEIAAMIK